MVGLFATSEILIHDLSGLPTPIDFLAGRLKTKKQAVFVRGRDVVLVSQYETGITARIT
jgi:hypothetical protein